MKIEDFKEKITIEEIISIMSHLGADYRNSSSSEKELLFKTICHDGNSHKLYFYKETKMFFCYTGCGSLDILNILENVLNLESPTLAKEYAINFLGWSNVNFKVGFEPEENVDIYNPDLEIFKNYIKKDKPLEIRAFREIDENILNNFYNFYHPSFLKDGISISTLKKFGVRYDILNQRIIIPHREETGKLIAIRCRNLNLDLIEEGRKYTPIIHNKKLLSAKTGLYLFGLNHNISNIKKLKKIILLESEKSVMQLDNVLDFNIGVALCSSNLSLTQVEIIRELGVEEVIIAMDKEFETYSSNEEKRYAYKIRKSMVDRLLPYFKVSVIWDRNNLLNKKDSPTDKGKEIFLKLYRERILIEG